MGIVYRHYPWLAALAALTAAALLVFSFHLSAVAVALLSLLAGYSLARIFSSKEGASCYQFPREDDDTSEDINATEEFFALRKLFEATLSGMREGLLVVDNDMRVVASNVAAHRLFNLSAGKLEAQRLTELTRNPAIYTAFLEVLKGKEKEGVRVETHHSDRRVFDLLVVPLGGSDGRNLQGAIGVFFDITRLEQLERVRQEFLSNVSHELRTPLTAILAFVETLETGALEDTENSRRFLSIIRKNATRMHTLIDDILELSAIESGNVKVEVKNVRLQPLVDDVVTSLAAKASSRSVSVENCVDPGVVVSADPARLEQMLTNLIDNAIKFNRETGNVRVTSEDSLQGNRIAVQDTGDGIPAQHLERLFERFYRVDRARSREMGGTGLGLAIVKHLVRAHGGEVTVQSKLGEGTTFGIDLPRPGNRPKPR